MLAPVTEMDFGEEGPLRMNMLARERWPGVRRGAGGGHRPSHRIPRHRRPRGGGRSRRRRGAPAPARAARLAGPRVRVADAVALPRARAGRFRRGSPGASSRRRTAARTRARPCARSPPRRGELELGVEVQAIEHDGSSVTGVRTSAGTIAAGQVVVAAGPWSASLAPLGEGPPVRPVKGQILELRARGFDVEPVRARAAHPALLPRARAATAASCSAPRSRSRASIRP